jgi:DNA-binding response OmpR family regulator
LGTSVCKILRERQIAAPILILTATEDADTKVLVLDTGADDYLVKPFNSDELEARVRALLRRPARSPTGDVLVVGDLELDLSSRQVTRAGQLITLRRKEFDILEYLVRNKGRTVTRAMIFEHAWEDGAQGWHNTVDVHIKHLRDKVDRPFGAHTIKTAYGVGYIFEPQEP